MLSASYPPRQAPACLPGHLLPQTCRLRRPLSSPLGCVIASQTALTAALTVSRFQQQVKLWAHAAACSEVQASSGTILRLHQSCNGHRTCLVRWHLSQQAC